MAVDQSTQSESARLTASKDQHVARGVATSPIFVEHAHGARLTDVDGREYIDFVGGIGTLNGGHTPEAVVAAIQEQAERYMHQCFSIAHVRAVHRGLQAHLRLHPGSFAEEGAARQLGRRGGRERRQDRPLRDRPRRGRSASTRPSTAARCSA